MLKITSQDYKMNAISHHCLVCVGQFPGYCRGHHKLDLYENYQQIQMLQQEKQQKNYSLYQFRKNIRKNKSNISFKIINTFFKKGYQEINLRKVKIKQGKKYIKGYPFIIMTLCEKENILDKFEFQEKIKDKNEEYKNLIWRELENALQSLRLFKQNKYKAAFEQLYCYRGMKHKKKFIKEQEIIRKYREDNGLPYD